MENTYVRNNSALINNDLAAYKAAKARREREKYLTSLEARINRLEEACESILTYIKSKEEQ